MLRSGGSWPVSCPLASSPYGFRYWNKAKGQRRWIAIGLHGEITPDQARTIATKCAGAVADNRDPLAEREESRAEAQRTANIKTVQEALEDFVLRYVRKGRLRSADQIEALLEHYVYPAIGKRPIYEIRRSEISDMLDGIEDKKGPQLADKVLAAVRKAFNWYATRDELFNSPIVRGMARTKPKELSRHRALTDDEIRHLWAALDGFAPPAYAKILRVLLLTGQRLNEVARLRWDETDGDGWTVPAERYKSKMDHTVPILPSVAAIIGQRPQKGEYVFSTQSGKTPFSGFSKAKVALDKRIKAVRDKVRLKSMPEWRLHDLRRTARSLMSRAGVTSDIAERVVGHLLPGMRNVYDKHSYFEEKREALERLGGVIEQILHPPGGNVVVMRKAPRTGR